MCMYEYTGIVLYLQLILPYNTLHVARDLYFYCTDTHLDNVIIFNALNSVETFNLVHKTMFP